MTEMSQIMDTHFNTFFALGELMLEDPKYKPFFVGFYKEYGQEMAEYIKHDPAHPHRPRLRVLFDKILAQAQREGY